MNLGCLLKLLASLITAGFVLVVGYGSLWLLWEVSHSSAGHWMFTILGIILGLIGLVVCLILIGVVGRFVWRRK